MTFRRYVIILLSLLCAWPAQGFAYECKTDPAVIGECFQSFGRLRFYPAAPHVRIWLFSQKRMLSIRNDELPPDLTPHADPKTEITGDFLVCPFTPEMPHVMQSVCIQLVSHMDLHHKNDLQ